MVFISLGASASYFGQWLQHLFIGQTATLIQQLAGIFIVFMGLIVAGWLTIPVLMKEKDSMWRKNQQVMSEHFLWA